MKLILKSQTTSNKRMVIFVQDSSASTGAGLAGLTDVSAGLTWYSWREDTGNAAGTAVSIVSATRGSFTSGGFIEIDATNLPGFYEIGVPNTVLATGATWAVMLLRGATNMAPVAIEINLVSFDSTDAVRLGLTALPNAAAAANGGLPTVDAANSVAIQSSIKKNVVRAGFTFPLLDAAGVAVTAASVTATRSIDGAAFGACANAVSELANGWYTINLAATDVNGNVIALRFAAAGAQDTRYTLFTQP